MCHNHSHVIARLLAEDTSYSLPVLTYQLASDLVTVESPQRDGGLVKLKTSGLLRVPSMMLGGFYRWQQPPMEAERMSLFFLPEGATITILKASWDYLLALPISPDPLPASERPLIATLRSDDWQDHGI